MSNRNTVSNRNTRLRDDSHERRPRSRKVTRERLLTAARTVMVRQGIQGVSVEQICDEAGFTRGAFYSNFSSKDDLVLSMFEQEKDTMLAHLNTAIDTEGIGKRDDEQALAAIIDRFSSAVPDSLDQYVLTTEFVLHAMRDADVASTYAQVWSTLLNDLCDLMERVMANRGREFIIAAHHVAAIMLGTWEMSFRTGDVGERDTEMLRQTLPAVLVSLTRERKVEP